MLISAVTRDDIDEVLAFIGRVHFAGERAAERDLAAERLRWAALVEAAADARVGCAYIARAADGSATLGVVAARRAGRGILVDVLLLDESVRGSMAGQRLMTTLQEHAAHHGFDSVSVWVPESSHRARGAFQRAGFAPVNESLTWDPSGESRQLYRRDAAHPAVASGDGA